jgi:hypothetical protein
LVGRALSILVVLGAVAAALGIATAGAAPGAHARAAKFPVSQFTCYPGKFSGFKIHKITISNQFDKLSTAVAVAPLRVCAPAIKNNEPIPDKVSHLVCFSIRVANGPTGTRDAVVTDQFGSHPLTVILSEPESICLPAAKSRTSRPGPVPTRLDHYVCYHVKPGSGFDTRTISLRDQFKLSRVDAVFKLETLCAPTSKNGGRVLHKTVHLLCYDVKSPVKAGNVVVRTQFGLLKASLALRTGLCEPAVKRLVQG